MTIFRTSIATGFLLLLTACASAENLADASRPGAAPQQIAPYQNGHGRDRPIIAVVGENDGTEMTDFLIPYDVLSRSQAAQVLAVSTGPGLVQLHPGLRIQPQASLEAFDTRFPAGADYVILPAMHKQDDKVLQQWLAGQSAKGATVVSICDGALVAADAGLLKGKRGTAHWATEAHRTDHYPDTVWVKNTRYVADGQMVSSAGISAALPVSLALVEAIAGRERAVRLAAEMGVTDWSDRHDSDRFQLSHFGNLADMAVAHGTNGWFHDTETIGIPLEPGIDEMVLAVFTDAYGRTGRSRPSPVVAAGESIVSRNGLTILPAQSVIGRKVDRMLPGLGGISPGQSFDKALQSVEESYGSTTSAAVALEFEYPRKAN